MLEIKLQYSSKSTRLNCMEKFLLKKSSKLELTENFLLPYLLSNILKL